MRFGNQLHGKFPLNIGKLRKIANLPCLDFGFVVTMVDCSASGKIQRNRLHLLQIICALNVCASANVK